MNTPPDEIVVRCSSCELEMDVCSFCDEAECAKPVCFTCVAVALKQMEPQPHAHGG